VGRPPKKQTVDTTVSTEVKDAVPYTPLLVTDHMSPAQLQELVEKVRIGGMKAIDAAIQRGRFQFSDIESITAALGVMLLNPMADPQIFRVSSALNPHLDRLSRLIKDRDTVELNEESAERIKQIEAALQDMAGGD
jgi:hypothetical protein